MCGPGFNKQAQLSVQPIFRAYSAHPIVVSLDKAMTVCLISLPAILPGFLLHYCPINKAKKAK